ncbi:MAG: hypothetical protein ACI83D_000053 [Planctomycetota bacterium]|jgi:hypothetical protein
MQSTCIQTQTLTKTEDLSMVTLNYSFTTKMNFNEKEHLIIRVLLIIINCLN